MAEDKVIFLRKWYNELINDEFSPLSAEEVSYILYAAARYSWTGEKTNFAEVFNRPDLNRTMAPYYPQIDRIENYRENNKTTKAGNQSYDNEAIKELAAEGVTQKKICEMLGYDPAKSRSLSSNKGYIEGRKIFLEKSQLEKSQKVSKTDKTELEKSESVRTDSEMSVSSVSSQSDLSEKSVSSESKIVSLVSSNSEMSQKSSGGFDF